jgi:hypothetical protein
MTDSVEPERYHEWLAKLKEEPFDSGSRGCALILAVLPAVLIFTIFGLTLFPAGTYPRLLLMLPGLLAGGVFLYILGFIAFNLPKKLAVSLCIIIAVAGSWAAIKLLDRLWS